MKRIFFVCTGNTCRSPMADAIFKDRIPTFWKDRISVSSAETSAWEGEPASRYAIEVLEENGIDLSSHRLRMLTAEVRNWVFKTLLNFLLKMHLSVAYTDSTNYNLIVQPYCYKADKV